MKSEKLQESISRQRLKAAATRRQLLLDAGVFSQQISLQRHIYVQVYVCIPWLYGLQTQAKSTFQLKQNLLIYIRIYKYGILSRLQAVASSLFALSCISHLFSVGVYERISISAVFHRIVAIVVSHCESRTARQAVKLADLRWGLNAVSVKCSEVTLD